MRYTNLLFTYFTYLLTYLLGEGLYQTTAWLSKFVVFSVHKRSIIDWLGHSWLGCDILCDIFSRRYHFWPPSLLRPEIFWLPPIIAGTGKATNFKFCTHFHTIDRNKSPLTISGNVAVGVARDSRKFFRASIYRAHRAVIFAIAGLSCIHVSQCSVYEPWHACL